EREGKAFFEDVASSAKHQRTKDTFASLVKQEQRHVDILTEELRRLEQGKDWASLQEMNATPTQHPKISVFKDKEIRRMKFDSEAGELEALKLGIKIEMKSMDYYRNAGQESTDPKAREIFNWLVGEEGGHLTILSAEYEYRIKSGFYYDNMEFSLEVE
ncbi:MAG TPA: ferritin family protein, partial [Thermoplasmata archaeon]|nr:ferritin family protein [Thermoplasmata archaeon]